MENYNTGYSTYVIGNSSNISNSLEVILYNKMIIGILSYQKYLSIISNKFTQDYLLPLAVIISD